MVKVEGKGDLLQTAIICMGDPAQLVRTFSMVMSRRL
jgi:hypothetical protein